MKREFRDIGWWLDPKTLDFHMRCPRTMADRHIQSDHRTGGRCLALRGQVAHSHVAARLDLRPVDVLLPLATNLDVVQVHCAPFAGRPLMTGQVDVSVG